MKLISFIKLFTLLSVICWLLYACGRGTNLGDYRLTAEQAKSIPYKLNDTIFFKSINSGKNDTLIVYEFYRGVRGVGGEHFNHFTEEEIICTLKPSSGSNKRVEFSFVLSATPLDPYVQHSTHVNLDMSMYKEKNAGNIDNCMDMIGSNYHFKDTNSTEIDNKSDRVNYKDSVELLNTLTINNHVYSKVIHVVKSLIPNSSYCDLGLKEFFYSLENGLIKYKIDDKEYINIK